MQNDAWTMDTLVHICGIYMLLFGVFHILFWKFFNWKSELKKLSLSNRAIMQILNLRIIYYFFFVAFVCFVFPNELYTTNLGKVFLAGNSIFWIGRAIEQFVFLRVNHLEVHVLTFLFIIGIILFALPLVI